MGHRRPTGLVASSPLTRLALGDPINRGLVGAWMGNEGGGAILRDMTGRANGAITGYASSMRVPGPKVAGHGNAIAFNGTSQYATVTSKVFSAVPALSVSFWCYQPARAGGWTPWFNTSDLISGFFVGKFTDASPLLYVGGVSCSSSFPAYPVGQWFHVAVSVAYSSPSATLVTGWINGVSSGSVGGGVMPTETAFEIAGNTANTYFSNCTLSGMRIWNRAITWSEAQRLYTQPIVGITVPRRITARAGTAAGLQVLSTYSVGSDWKSTILSNHVVPAQWTTTNLTDLTSVADWRCVILRDSVGWATWNQPTLRDALAPLELKLGILRDIIDPLDWLINILADAKIPSEFSGITALISDALVYIDWRSTLVRDVSIQDDSRSSLLSDRYSNVDWGISLTPADRSGSVEWGLAAARDLTVPTDWKGTVSVNALDYLEFAGITALIGDASLPIEWRSTLFREEAISNERRANLSVDVQNQIDNIASLAANSTGIIDLTSSAIRDISGAIDPRSALFIDTFSPLDFSGITAISVDAPVPIEWRSSLIADRTITAQWTSSIQVDLRGSTSWLLTIRITAALPLNWRSALSVDNASSIDWTSAAMRQLLSDAVISIDWTLRQDYRITKGAQLTVQTVLRGI